tara:strand:- start:13359 stop:14579 length:1221 start_codon:yes stop_codon:yes gene_type:complete
LFHFNNTFGFFLLPALLLFGFVLHSQQRLVNPLAGQYGKDFILVNYVDWGVGSSVQDQYCLDKSYNGHQGTDYVLQHFVTMDKGIPVLAVDSGVVIFVKDGEFDREKKSDTSKHLGNYVGITHPGKLQTYYGHLKKGSILVQVGDRVVPGQKIALVGSSGNSSDPHLHFELWYDSLYYIDPFKGPCGNAGSYWKNELAYDSSFYVWNNGILNFKPTLDTLKEGLTTVDTIYPGDQAITFWSLLHGLRTGDSVSLEWYTPSDQFWFRYDIQLNRNWWYYYYWSYIDVPKKKEFGLWNVQLKRNNVLVLKKSFFLINPPDTSLSQANLMPIKNGDLKSTIKTLESTWEVHSPIIPEAVSLWNADGKLIKKLKPTSDITFLNRSGLPPGIYFLVIQIGTAPQRIKVSNF